MVSVILLSVIMMPVQPPSEEAIKLTVTPQLVPSPAFRYALLPPLSEKTTGNAVQSYYRCMAPDSLAWFHRNKMDGRIFAWLELPYEEAAKKGQVRPEKKKTDDDDEERIPAATLEELAFIKTMKVLDEIDVAARRTHAEWEYLEKIKQSGFYLLLPEIQGIRNLSTMLMVRARLQLVDGKYDASLHHLQSGMALARHLDETQLIIGTLTGNAIARAMTKVMVEWVQQPGSPNLYWALSDLPRPYFDLRKSFEGDRLATQNMMGDYTVLKERIVSVEEMRRMVEERLKPAMRMFGNGADLSLLIMKEYPRAKAWLKEQGRSAEDIVRMPATQAVLLHALWQQRLLADEYQKILLMPPLERLRRAEKIVKRLQSGPGELSGYLGMAYYPSYPNVWLSIDELDRELVLLRCIEAIRHYAAGHGKTLPAAWEEITDLPIPVDPVTGEKFGYLVAGNHAVLTLKAIKTDREWRREKVYEVYLK